MIFLGILGRDLGGTSEELAAPGLGLQLRILNRSQSTPPHALLRSDQMDIANYQISLTSLGSDIFMNFRTGSGRNLGGAGSTRLGFPAIKSKCNCFYAAYLFLCREAVKPPIGTRNIEKEKRCKIDISS